MHDDTLQHVAAAVGDYDGHRFVPASWRQLTPGSSAFATTAFADRSGRACVMSWLREESHNDPTLTVRAGAHSVPAPQSVGPGSARIAADRSQGPSPVVRTLRVTIWGLPG